MKISMKTLASGPTGVLRPGVVYDLPEEEAKQLIEGRYAAAVEDSTPAPGPDAAKVVVPVEESKVEKDGSEDDEPSKDEVDPNDPDSVLASMKAKVEGTTSTDPETPASDPAPANP